MNNYLQSFLENSEISVLGPPDASGVYAIMMCKRKSKKHEILYIGSAKNIRKRLLQRNHFYLKLYSALSDDFLIFTKSMITDDYINAEKFLIKHFKPVFNTNGK